MQAPEPAEPWKPAVLDAFKYSNMCIQPIDPANKPHPQHEDCLYLNVYIPGEIPLNTRNSLQETYNQAFIFYLKFF